MGLWWDVVDENTVVKAENYSDLNAAITAAKGLGKNVLLPSLTILKSTVTLQSNVALIAGSAGSVVRGDFAAPTQAMFVNDWVNGSTDIALRGITIDRTGPNTQHGILLNSVTGLDVEGCTFIGPSSANSGSVSVSGIGPAAPLLSSGVRVRGCRFIGSDNYGLQVGYVRGVSIVNNTFEDNFREAIGVEPPNGTTAENVSITGNTISTSTVGGGSQTGLIVVTQSSGGTVTGVTVADNTIEGYNVTAGQTMPGIAVYGGSGITVSGNVVNGVPGAGILVGNSLNPVTGISVTDNATINCNAGGSGILTGIYLAYTSNTLVSGNRIKGASHVASLTEDSHCSNNWIVGNQLLDTTAWTTPPASSWYAGNRTGAVELQQLSPLARRGVLSGVSNTAVAVGAGATAIASLRNASSMTGTVTNYGGLLLVQARQADTDAANTATYLLLISKAAANSVCVTVASGGLTAGTGGTWPSFTFALDTVNNKLTAAPIGSTSTTAAWEFHITSLGDLAVGP